MQEVLSFGAAMGLTTVGVTSVGLASALALLPARRQRIELSRAKHRSLAGHSHLAKRLDAFLPGYAFDETQFFASDDAPAEVVARRCAGLDHQAPSTRGALPPARR